MIWALVILRYQFIPYDWLKSEFIAGGFRILLIVHCDCDIFGQANGFPMNDQVYLQNSPHQLFSTGGVGCAHNPNPTHYRKSMTSMAALYVC